MPQNEEDKAGRASWNHPRDLCLVTNLQFQSDIGKRAAGGFKKEAWKFVTNAFNTEFDVVYFSAQMKSRFDVVSTYLNI